MSKQHVLKELPAGPTLFFAASRCRTPLSLHQETPPQRASCPNTNYENPKPYSGAVGNVLNICFSNFMLVSTFGLSASDFSYAPLNNRPVGFKSGFRRAE